jgi:hypothetical protein
MENACTLFVPKPDVEKWTEVRIYRNVLLYNEVQWDRYNVFQTAVQQSIMYNYKINSWKLYIVKHNCVT